MGYAQRISSAVHLSYRFMRPTTQLIYQIHWSFSRPQPIPKGMTNAVDGCSSFAIALHPFT